MTTTSPICPIKSRLSTTTTTTTNVSSMTNNAYDHHKPSRISTKSLNGCGEHSKKRSLQINPYIFTKNKSIDQQHQSLTSPVSPPLIFHPLPASPTSETNGHLTHSNGYHHQSEKKPKDHTIIEESLEKLRTKVRQSSESDNECHVSKSHVLLSVDTDADESDNEEKKNLTKTRRLQKTRKASNSSLQYKLHYTPPVIRKLRRSSSNDDEDDENRESISRLNETNFSNRRNKHWLNRKFHHFNVTTTTTTATTTTDEDTRKQPMRHQTIEPSGGNSIGTTTTAATHESTFSSPIPTMVAPVRKINRFQVKSIRKSQQAHILLANARAAKSSNDDDCSVPNEKPCSQVRPAIIERQSTNTPTTDGENPVSIVRENGHHHHLHHNHHVHFQITCPAKQESLAEEEKLVAPSTNLVTIPNPAPPTSNNKSQGEDDEEEEAVGSSPDGRFIKYAKEIGRGAFKTVYRGLDTETSVAVAWCELQDFAQFDKHERARFKEEAEMLKKLQHQNIVRFYDFWEETNPRTNKKVIILVTELMTSGSLKSYIRKFRVHKEEKRINVMKKWCRQILKGLAYLHSRNPPVIHRDLKCDNVFISGPTGCVKIGDLGLATFKTQTFAKSMRGTMEFMAPEMFDEKYDELVDIYSFGLCMLEMITGEYPYIECKGPTAVIKRVTSGLKPDCYFKVESEDVREVIDCCIRTKKEERLCVHELLQHSFFLDDNGLRIDLVRDSSAEPDMNSTRNESIDFKLKVTDKNKRKILWTEHEAIRFRYNLKDDTPEQIADELIEKKYIFDDDRKFVIQSIKDRLRAFNYEQIDRKAGIYCRDGKPSITQTPSVVQPTPAPTPIPISIPSQPATPPIVPPTLTPVLPITPTPSLVQPSPIDLTPQAPTVMTKPSSEVPINKPAVVTEPIPIAQLSELSSSVSGSAGSLEVLDAALKKTFHKNSISQNASNSISLPTNDAGEPPTPLVNTDESSVFRSTATPSMTNTVMIQDQSSTEEAVENHSTELINNLIQPQTTTSIGLQSQSQPTTMVTNHQQQILTNPLPPPSQVSQNFSYSIGTSPNNFLPNPSTNETIKPAPPSSSSTIESMENSHLPLSLSNTNETISSSILSDTSSTTQTQIPGSLQHLDALLTSTFKNSGKTNGTAYNSDTEATTNPIPSVPVVINDELLSKPIDVEPITSDLINRPDETKVKLLDLFTNPSPSVPLILHSQPNISTSNIITSSLTQSKSQPASRSMSSDFDPLVSPEQVIDPLETLLKTPCEKSSSNDDTIIAASSNELSEIKSMLMDLSRTLITRMTIIEQKIDEHRQQTQRIDYLLTQTVLPSLIDITDIIQETSTTNIDPRVRTKLESIRTNIRSTQIQQQQQQMEMKDLMEI